MKTHWSDGRLRNPAEESNRAGGEDNARADIREHIARNLPIADIRLDFQPPENLIEETVLEYVQRLQGGESLPPIYVRFDGSNYFCQDGFHRIEAMKRAGLMHIVAVVRPGSLADMAADFAAYLAELKKSLRS
jgi:hypothetical protein